MKKNLYLFVVCSGLASALNYLTYPLLSRLLPSSQFIHITVALSLFTQMSTFLSSVVALTIGLTKQATHEATKEIDRLQASLTKFFTGVIIVFTVVSPLILPALRLPVGFALPICLLLIISLPTATASGHLNGLGELKKLGVFTLIGAILQLGFATMAAYITRDGILALILMAIGQLVAILLIYRLFSSTSLPSLLAVFHRTTSSNSQRLLGYALLTSLAIMVVNILQVADLLVVNAAFQSQARLYTDLYIISRIVYFAGSIFIWPFLSALDIRHPSTKNIHNGFRLCLFFGILGLGAWLGLMLLGNQITRLLFGTVYSFKDMWIIGGLSILYKLLFLIITTLSLAFIVFHKYTLIYVAAGLLVSIGIASFIFRNYPLTHFLIALCSLGFVATLYLGVAFAKLHTSKDSSAT